MICFIVSDADVQVFELAAGGTEQAEVDRRLHPAVGQEIEAAATDRRPPCRAPAMNLPIAISGNDQANTLSGLAGQIRSRVAWQ